METRDSGRGFKFVCDPAPNQHPSWWSFTDEQSVRDALWHPAEGDTVLDVGCAYGSYTLPSLASGARHVYAWNPLQSELDVLAMSLEANGWSDRVTAFREAVYSKSGFVNPDTMGFSEVEGPGFFPTRPLDDFLPLMEFTGRCWMKIDVEGVEVEVLRGARALIEAHRPTILVEGHEFKKPGITGEVEALLASQGYRTEANMPYHSVRHALLLP